MRWRMRRGGVAQRERRFTAGTVHLQEVHLHPSPVEGERVSGAANEDKREGRGTLWWGSRGALIQGATAPASLAASVTAAAEGAGWGTPPAAVAVAVVVVDGGAGTSPSPATSFL